MANARLLLIGGDVVLRLVVTCEQDGVERKGIGRPGYSWWRRVDVAVCCVMYGNKLMGGRNFVSPDNFVLIGRKNERRDHGFLNLSGNCLFSVFQWSSSFCVS